MPVKTKCVYAPAQSDDGFRLLVMRLWPRGVAKTAVDAWEQELGTPPELIRKWKKGAVSWSAFAREYHLAVRAQKDRIADLARRARKETITLLCGCRDEAHCHRVLLKEMIDRAARK